MRRALALGLLVVSACSGGGSHENAATALSRAVQNTMAARSCRLEVVIGGRLHEFLVEDFRTHNTVGRVEGIGDAISTEIRFIDGVEYVKVPRALAKDFGNPKTPWVSYGGPGQRPAGLTIEVLFYAAYNVKRLGARSFTGFIDLLNVVNRMPANVRTALTKEFDLKKGAQSIASVVGFHPSFTITLDAHDRVSGFTLSSTPSNSTAQVRWIISDFGVRTSITSPPGTDVTPWKGRSGPTI